MHTLKVCHFRGVASFDQRVKPCFHQLDDSAAEYRLFAEQIGLGLLTERCLNDSCPSCTDTAGIGKRVLTRFAGCVLMNGD